MKLVRVAIFLTGITGLAAGGIMTISSLKANQREMSLRTNDELKSQATQFVDQFFGVLEASKNLNPETTSAPSYVTERAVVKLDQNAPTEFESFTSTDARRPINAQPDFALEERVMDAIKKDFSFADLKISRLTMGTYHLSEAGTREGIYIASPIYKTTNGVTDSNTIEKVNITLIDPVKAFAGLQKVSSTQDTAAFLVNRKGRVLAHSISAYVGTDLRHVDHIKDTIENLFLGAQTGGVSRYKDADGEEQQIAFVRAGASPFAFAVEQRAKPAVLTSAWWSDEIDSGAARQSLGLLFVIIAASLVAFSAISIWASREVSKQIAENSTARASNRVAPAFPHAQEILQPFSAKIAQSTLQKNTQVSSPAPVSNSTENFVAARDQIALEQEQLKVAIQGLSVSADVTRDFVNKIEKAYTLEAVEKELVQLSSELSESPVLYFRYQRRTQNLSLSAVGGEVKIQNYVDMQAYVRKDIELQVEHMADDGKVASVSNYGPMSKLMITHLNVAHFEAWGVTSHPEVSGQSKLVGVLVVLQAGMKSAQTRPVLAKILKEAGNYLYAQSNKIRPKSSHYQTPHQTIQNNPSLEDSYLS
jgi:hypothetical protein